MKIKKVNSAGAIIYTIENKKPYFLLLKHKKGGHWGFPKGRIEEGESIEQAVNREMIEETGIKNIKYQKGFQILKQYNFVRDSVFWKKEVIFFLGYAVSYEIKLSDEHEKFMWVDLDNTLKILDKFGYKDIIKSAYQTIKNNHNL